MEVHTETFGTQMQKNNKTVHKSASAFLYLHWL